MKLFVGITFALFVLCNSTAQARPLSADDVKFLKGCDIAQADIDVISKLARVGQMKIGGILMANDRQCTDLKPFQATRKFSRVFNPPPSSIPVPPIEYDADYLTQAELGFINKWEKDMLVKQGVLAP
ncbi:MAG: hypothetical protein WAU78_12160 [Roseiarcus sp.]